ncbi:MAG TPA: tRNA (adenosine(37)-N6)-dimethylallyltransferase MiaA [Myxococcota bacterium]|nr:tRNA (adenosine(37)-N6)-dimethylallyltransferase MiaA [Myxococcota bacterium]
MSLAHVERPPVVVVGGPTAAGKSHVAIDLALRFEGEIVNADSVQVYRYLDVGTAKPTTEERARVPHHLLDVVKPDVPYNAGRYLGEARAAAQRVHARGRLVILAGGTGLYVRACLEGLIPGVGSDAGLRARLEAEDAAARRAGEPERLHQRLAGLDPEAAARTHPSDARRVIRALELCALGGPASLARRRHGFADRPYRVLHLVLDPGREELDRRIDARCARMLDAGLLREVRGLRAMGYGPELRSLQAIGYRHLHPVVDGLDTLANALEAMRRDTRRFARRQRTWWRGVPEAVWMNPEDADSIAKAVEAFLGAQAISTRGAAAADPPDAPRYSPPEV